MSDDSLSDRVSDALDEVDTASSGSALDNYRTSLAGWRNMAGVTLGFAVFIDLLFVILAAAIWQATTGTAGTAAAATLACFGLFGLVEKTWRRR